MTDDRTALVHGLIQMAVFLQANHEVPAPHGVTVHHFIPRADDDQMRAQIDHLAALLGSDIDAGGGHYGTSRLFGPVEYRAVAILADARATYAAQDSYRGCVTPDTVKET
ncbi:hypothetical protein LDL08_33135 [Nonomuraea glycinis]|uniref:Uncharacterized protein n=1 Tax=Nonomuraea glycinis TaxID=2047744 RepID=A0A918EBZ5_9ACTN|nr:hypothetical protein [Nonomuraea glycinis]MCA2181034.1 hypothetical protein [Nonomuraea glycinis]GGP18435.1 hypothetical protein GCM10012278_90610 [Nonomuraea glycinis]